MGDLFVESLRTLFSSLQSQIEPVAPFMFLQAFRSLFPQFAEQEGGYFMQQDAEEAWSQLLIMLKQKLTRNSPDGHSSVIDDLFGIRIRSMCVILFSFERKYSLSLHFISFST